MSERTAVYRLFDADDALLYVGISKSFGVRWERHAYRQPWWPEVHHQTVEWRDTRKEADEAETAAIRNEKPRYNIAKVPPPPPLPNTRPIAEARTDLSGLVDMARYGRRIVFLTSRGRPIAAIAPTEFAEMVELAGGPDAAIAILRRARAA
jgi:prevent-host-death family protein